MSIPKNGLTSKGFKALLITQFLGAFNDNVFKLVISIFAVEGGRASAGVAQAGLAFVLPFLVFSMWAGFLADRFSKRNIIIITKAAEVVVMILGMAAFASGSFGFMLFVLFLMGAQSSFFSPAKYGILPEILDISELSRGNGSIQMWTFMAIISGSAVGGVILSMAGQDIYLVSYILILVSLAGLVTSVYVEKVYPAGSVRPFRVNFLKEMSESVRLLADSKPLFTSILGIAFFWFSGAMFQMNITVFANEILNVGRSETGMLLATVAVGIGIGSLLAGRLSGNKVEFGLVPLGSIFMAASTFMLGFFHSSAWLCAFLLSILGISCGFFIVPLNAFIQQKSKKEELGRTLSTTNFLTFSAMLFASFVLWFMDTAAGFDPAGVFVAMGAMISLFFVYTYFVAPQFFIRFILWILTHSLYDIKIVGRENIPERGPALFVCNHVSYIDALIVGSCVQRVIRFLIWDEFYHNRLLKPLFMVMKSIPLKTKGMHREITRSLKQARTELDNGHTVCIFAEGSITRTGNMLPFKSGFQYIMKGSRTPIIPIHLDRVWGSIFSYERQKFIFKWPKKIPYRVTISFGAPMPADSSAFQVRARVQELGAEAFEYRIKEKSILPAAFLKEARSHPTRLCMSDSTGKSLNYSETFVAALSLSWILARRLRKSSTPNIGLLLPTSVVAAISNIAVLILKKVAVNLNFSAPQDIVDSAVSQCEIQTIITSRQFIEKTGTHLPKADIIWIEDLAAMLSFKLKARALACAFLLPFFISKRLIFGSTKQSMQDSATIIFSSGSTGSPKGVVLSHANITSNIEASYQVFRLNKKDSMAGVLPFFHAFGYTVTLWFPIITGIAVVYHPNPADAKNIGSLIENYKTTILLATPTFLSAYIRKCSNAQFKSLRIVLTGAEKLRKKDAGAFYKKFKLRPMEGYGCTELSPVVAVGVENHDTDSAKQIGYKPGTIGHPLPGVAVKIIDPETFVTLGADMEGLMLIKGTNIMKGYYKKPEETKKVMRNGWYITGDIARIDNDGFITITDRQDRFSKIAGEMVPHIRLEEIIHEVEGKAENFCVVTSVEDPQKGERLIVLYTQELDITTLLKKIKDKVGSNLWIPRKKDFFKVEKIPVLAIGKTDLNTVKKIASEKAKTHNRQF